MKKYPIFFVIISILMACTPNATLPDVNPSDTPVSISTPVILPTTISTEQILEITDTPVQTEPIAIGEIALAHINAISEGIGARPAGTEKEVETAQYIVSELKQLGYTPELQSFTATIKENIINSANVIAVKEGVSSQEIIIGAHYDSVDIGKGADDNASGIGVILEVAQLIKDKPTPYTIRFIFFGAEEVGLQGSKYYIEQITDEQIQNTIGMINLDSLTAGDFAYIYGDEGEKGFIRDWALEYAATNNFTLQTQTGENPEYPAGTTGDWSDHAPFKYAGIPYTYLESTNWTLGKKDGYTQVSTEYGKNGEIWHTDYDTLEYIQQTFPERVQERLNLFVTVLEAILTEFKL